MKGINWFYVALIALIPLLFWLLKPEDESDIAFFGFAENLETEINYNYDVVVDKIMVSSGQKVNEGSPLMKISRKKSKEVLEDQNYEIKTLEAEERAWKGKKVNEISLLKIKLQNEEEEIRADLTKVQNEITYKKSLLRGLDINQNDATYQPLQIRAKELTNELSQIRQRFEVEKKSLEEEIRLGVSPFRRKIEELNAEKEFDASHKITHIDVTAPEEGLIGNIYCKEAEHVPAFKTLLTFYEPHSGIIKGYVHEDLTMSVSIGEIFEVHSLKDEEVRYEGKVIGLGSRIIEIPARLRKFAQVKTYGREVTIAIPTDNIFLQKEKVGIKIKQVY